MRSCWMSVCRKGLTEFKKTLKVVADMNFILRYLSFRHVVQHRGRWCFDRSDAGLEIAERGDWCGVSM